MRSGYTGFTFCSISTSLLKVMFNGVYSIPPDSSRPVFLQCADIIHYQSILVL